MGYRKVNKKTTLPSWFLLNVQKMIPIGSQLSEDGDTCGDSQMEEAPPLPPATLQDLIELVRSVVTRQENTEKLLKDIKELLEEEENYSDDDDFIDDSAVEEEELAQVPFKKKFRP